MSVHKVPGMLQRCTGGTHGQVPHYVMACGLILAGAWQAFGDEPVVFEHNGPAKLLLQVPQSNGGIALKLADVLKLTLQVDGPKTLEVQAPDMISNSPKWRLLERSPAATFALEKDSRRWQRTYTFEPLVPGALSLQIEPLLIREGGGVFRKVLWKPVPVQVTTTITEPDLKSLRDPTVIEALPPLPEARPFPWLGVGLGVLVAAVAALIYFRRRRTRAALVPAEQWALREFDRLRALHLPEKGKIERFHTLLANVVRRYLEKKFQLPARRRTTPEFLDVLQSAQKLSEPQRAFLRDFLRSCDLAKFARVDASEKECLDWADKVRAFIQESAAL
jgi:hypothetical protein